MFTVNHFVKMDLLKNNNMLQGKSKVKAAGVQCYSVTMVTGVDSYCDSALLIS